MVERSKKPSSPGASSSRRGSFEREQMVLLEAMRADFRVFGEALQGFDAKLQGFDATLQGFDAKVQGFDATLQGFDAKLQGFDATLQGFDAKLQGFGVELQSFRDDVDARFDRVDHGIGLLKDGVASNTREIKNVQVALTHKADRVDVEALAQRVARQG